QRARHAAPAMLGGGHHAANVTAPYPPAIHHEPALVVLVAASELPIGEGATKGGRLEARSVLDEVAPASGEAAARGRRRVGSRIAGEGGRGEREVGGDLRVVLQRTDDDSIVIH